MFAVVPACGHSTRMGRAKLALPLGDCTVIEHVVASLLAGGVARVVVVVGPHVSELVPLARAAGADVLALAEPTPDMRATVERGLSWIEKRYHTAPDDGWLLAPGDHPAFTADVVRRLLAVTESSVVVPTHNSQRGHPTLLRWHHAAGIRALPPGEGINAYLRRHANDTLELPVTEPGVLANLDTLEDYARLREWIASPDRRTAFASPSPS